MVAMLEELNKTTLLAATGLELQHAHQIIVFESQGTDLRETSVFPFTNSHPTLHVEEFRYY